jgi:hypothetical protein
LGSIFDPTWGWAAHIQHTVPNEGTVVTLYWHINQTGLASGSVLHQGQQFSTLYNLGANSHIHLGVWIGADDNHNDWRGGLPTTNCGGDAAFPASFVDPQGYVDGHRVRSPAVTISGSATAYAFWKGPDGNLWQSQGDAHQGPTVASSRGMGTLGSAPAAGIDSAGNTYVYWQGGDHGLWEAYWDPTLPGWRGPIPRGMSGQLASPPAVAINSAGTAFVFWKGNNGDLWEAQGDARFDLFGPYDRGFGVLGSGPAVGIDGSSFTYVFWRGGDLTLWGAYWDGTHFAVKHDPQLGSLGSPPTVAINTSINSYVFWKGANDANVWEGQGDPRQPLFGPYNRGMTPLGSGPAVGIDSQSHTYTYWEGTGPGFNLTEMYWDGTNFRGWFNLGMGPLS